MPVTTAPLLSGSILDEEIALELSAVDEGAKRYRQLAADAVNRGAGAELKPAERLALYWFEPLREFFEFKAAQMKAGTATDVNADRWGGVFKLVPPARSAYATIHRAIGLTLMSPSGVPLTRASFEVGDSIVAEANIDELKKGHRDDYEALTRRVRELNAFRINKWARKTLTDDKWSRQVCVGIGAFCLYALAGIAGTRGDVFVPAFRVEKRRGRKGFEVSTLILSDEAHRFIEEGHEARRHLRPRHLPMIVPPYPWVQYKNEHGNHVIEGGYAKNRTPYICKPTREQKDALSRADLSFLNACRTDLESTPWRVNRRVRAVQAQMYKEGGGILDIPRADDMPAPPRPAGFDSTRSAGRWKNVDPDSTAEYKRRAAATIKQNIADSSLRKTFDRTAAVADMFSGRDAFYLPHQFDFRGRCYPIPPALNHHGDDLRRGLLEFSEAKEMGDQGRRELEIEAANCYGLDKLSYDDRSRWARDSMREIARAAADPLDNEWWRKAKKPWQFLATCFALTDPEAGAHAPVRRDGTCNGLQHYCALSRDEVSAAAVNIIPGTKPASIYSDVAAAVRPLVADDAERSSRVLAYHDFRTKSDVEVPVRDIAAAILPMIGKETVKGPVMITVYGAKHVGTRRAIQDALKDLGFDPKLRYIAARYLADRVIVGLGSACAGASQIMEWLRSCARMIVSTGNPVRWTTPMGLPIVQPYRQHKRCRVETVWGTLNLKIREDWVPIDTTKQINGVAPNFIHPIDAACKLTVARECRRHGVTFAGVHDQYWGHAADEVHRARINRERFVALHERDILGELHAQWSNMHPDLKFPPPPERGKLDIRQVLESPYFFS